MSARPFDDAIRHPVMGCTCAEGRYQDASGVQHWAPAVHDCAYVAHRGRLAASAEAEALTRCEKGKKDPAWGAEFLAAMDREVVAHPFVALKPAPCLCGVAHVAA